MIAVALALGLAVLLWPGPPHSRATSPAAVTPLGSGDLAETAALLAAALRSGIGVCEAIDVVAALGPPPARPSLRAVAAGQRWGLSTAQAWAAAGPTWTPVARAVVAAQEAGLSPVRALDTAVASLRRDLHTAARSAVGRLEVLVVLPLGLAFLPGFVLTTVVPIVIGLARSVSLP